MKTLLAAFAAAACATAIAGCSSSSTESAAPTSYTEAANNTPSAAATSTHILPKWVGSGVFSVGMKASGGAKASIPPGRYTVELQDGRNFGVWYRCTGLPCSPTSGNTIDTGTASGAGFSTVIDILPTDGAIYGDGVDFIAVG